MELGETKPIVDSGTTDTYLHEYLFEKVIQAFQNETLGLGIPHSFWNGESKLAWPTHLMPQLLQRLPTFKVTLQGTKEQPAFALIATPDQYLREIEGTRQEQNQSHCYPHCSFNIFAIKKRPCGNILGGMFMTGFLTVFDREANQVGFAVSQHHLSVTDSRRLIQIESKEVRQSCDNQGCEPSWVMPVFYSCAAGTMVFLSISVVLAAYLHGKCKFCSTALISTSLEKLRACFIREALIVPVQESGGRLIEEGGYVDTAL